MASIAWTPGPNLTLAPAATTNQYIRVTINSSGLAAIAGATVVGVGVTQDYGTTSDRVAVRLFSAEGTHVVQASTTEAIAAGDSIYTAAAGQFTKTSGGGNILVGIAKTSAAVQGDLFELVYAKQA